VLGDKIKLMVHPRTRTARTDADALVGNLRGEIGEEITTWILLRHIMSQRRAIRSDHPGTDLKNPELAFLNLLADRLNDDLVASLSELAEEKIGRTNFHFAEVKLGIAFDSARRFRKFVEKHQFKQKRNQHIAHKEQPEQWLDQGLIPIQIKYQTLLKALALAVRAMKAIDAIHIGPTAPYLWAEVRKKRYELLLPGKVGYILLPHIWLPDHVAAKFGVQ
jgi:hypothetical protein